MDGQASGVPSPPLRDWYGLAGVRGASRVRRGVGAVGWGLPGGGQGDREGRDLRRPFASHKPYNAWRVPVFTNLNLY